MRRTFTAMQGMLARMVCSRFKRIGTSSRRKAYCLGCEVAAGEVGWQGALKLALNRILTFGPRPRSSAGARVQV